MPPAHPASPVLPATLDEQVRQELLDQGGKVKVPCLRIEESEGKVSWLYDSNAIVEYLQGRFANQA